MKQTIKEREFWIDAVRSFACLCVLCTHSINPHNHIGMSIIPFYNMIAVGGASILFFMISGALVFNRQQEFMPFMKKRVTRVFGPMFFWTIVLLSISRFMGKASWSSLWPKLWLIPLYPQKSIYWFIYVIFGIYLLTPAISTWLAHTKRREVEYVLLIWAVTLILPYFDSPMGTKMIDATHGYLYYFYGYVGFALLGYYLRRYAFYEAKFSWKFAVAPIVVVSLIIVLYLSNTIDHKICHNRMTLHMALLASSYFMFLKKVPLSRFIRKFVFTFAQHSFGIYLVHQPIIHLVIWPLWAPLHINLIIEIPLIVILGAALSFSVIWLIGKIVPGSKYIVGV